MEPLPLVEKGLQILVGDANGADKAIQRCLADNSYPNVFVHCMKDHCRNNVGNSPTCEIDAPPGARRFDYYSLTDRAMAGAAEYGLMLWDGRQEQGHHEQRRQPVRRPQAGRRVHCSEDASSEYGTYIQECFPIPDDRRAFFQEKVRKAVPHIGYRLLIKLAEAGVVQSVWSPNFDGLAAKAAAQSQAVSPIEIGIDCQERLPRRPRRNELLCVSLHGDYRYGGLKNTPAELQEQEGALRRALIQELKDAPLIVVGYSGRDESLMAALDEAYREAGTGVLYWCGFGDGDIPGSVRRLLETARSSGRSAFYVQSAGFDDLMLRIALHCLDGAAVEEARALIHAQVPLPTQDRADFTLPQLATCGIVKSNAFPLQPPAEIYEFELTEWPASGMVWDYFDNCTDGREIVAAPFRGKAYAFGTFDEIRVAFKERIGAKLERVPINDIDLRFEDGVISALIRRAVVRAMASSSGVYTDGREILWESAVKERRREGDGTPNDVQNGVAVDASASEGAILSHLRSAVDLRDAFEHRRRRGRVGNAAPPTGRRAGVQEVLADAAADEAGGAPEAQSLGKRVGGRFGASG